MGKHKGLVPLEMKMGPITAFSPAHENILVEWVIMMGKSGFPVSKDTVSYSVKSYLQN